MCLMTKIVLINFSSSASQQISMPKPVPEKCREPGNPTLKNGEIRHEGKAFNNVRQSSAQLCNVGTLNKHSNFQREFLLIN